MHWPLSDLCCGGLSSWNQSRISSMTCGCSRCGSCHRSPFSWCLCKRFRWRPPPRSSPPPSSRCLQRVALYTRPGAGSRTWQCCRGKTGGLSWGQLFCSLGISRAVCRLSLSPEWAGKRLRWIEDKLIIYLTKGSALLQLLWVKCKWGNQRKPKRVFYTSWSTPLHCTSRMYLTHLIVVDD